MLRLITGALLAGLLSACAGGTARGPAAADLPLLRLSPASLGGELALQQRLTFSHRGRQDTVDALVEADATAVRLVMHGQGQVALRLQWDGVTLEETRAEWLPPQLSGERVLSDLQLVFWPIEAVAAALPAGWRMDETSGRRTLSQDGATVAWVEQASASRRVLHQPRQAYSLQIDSVAVEP